MKTETLKSIKELFQKNPEVNNVYVTSDENIFRAEHYAHNWRCSLADKTITTVTRAQALGVQTSEATDPENNDISNGDSSTNSDNGANDERAAAVKRYIELFDTKPSHFMKLETIKAKIAEKEASLNEDKQPPESNTDNKQGEQQ